MVSNRDYWNLISLTGPCRCHVHGRKYNGVSSKIVVILNRFLEFILSVKVRPTKITTVLLKCKYVWGFLIDLLATP